MLGPTDSIDVPWSEVFIAAQALAAMVTVVVMYLAIKETRKQYRNQRNAEVRRERSKYYGLLVRDPAFQAVRELGSFLSQQLEAVSSPSALFQQLALTKVDDPYRELTRRMRERVSLVREETLVGAESWEDKQLVTDLRHAFEAVEDAVAEEVDKADQGEEPDRNRIRRCLSEVLMSLKKADPGLGGPRTSSGESQD